MGRRLNLAALQKAFLKEVKKIERNLSKDMIHQDIKKMVDDHTQSIQETYEEITGEGETEAEERPVIKESD
jgi:hypothetical protein